MSQIDRLQRVIEPTVLDMGFDLWGVEYQTSSGTVLLRVYIDASDGISVENCADVSRQLSVVLDVEDLIRSEYRLEVSSPGMARPFFRFEQYQGYLGFVLKVKLNMPYEGRRQIKGILSRVDTESREIAIVEGEEEYLLPYELIEKSQLLPQFD